MFNRSWVPVYQNSASSYDQFCVAATAAKIRYALKMDLWTRLDPCVILPSTTHFPLHTLASHELTQKNTWQLPGKPQRCAFGATAERYAAIEFLSSSDPMRTYSTMKQDAGLSQPCVSTAYTLPTNPLCPQELLNLDVDQRMTSKQLKTCFDGSFTPNLAVARSTPTAHPEVDVADGSRGEIFML